MDLTTWLFARFLLLDVSTKSSHTQIVDQSHPKLCAGVRLKVYNLIVSARRIVVVVILVCWVLRLHKGQSARERRSNSADLGSGTAAFVAMTEGEAGDVGCCCGRERALEGCD